MASRLRLPSVAKSRGGTFVAVYFYAFSCAQVVGVFAGELAVGGKAAYAVIDVAVLGGVGFAVLLQLLNHCYHLSDVFGGFGFVIGGQYA